MRLIDADKLEISKIAEVADEYGDTVPVYGVTAEEIDNAPTVDAEWRYKMREQLTQLIKQAHTDYLLNDDCAVSIYEFIADRLIENGAILPPVKVGQTVYQTDGTRIYELIVNGVCDIIYDADAIAFSGDVIGERIFLTREAAEAALKAREQNA